MDDIGLNYIRPDPCFLGAPYTNPGSDVAARNHRPYTASRPFPLGEWKNSANIRVHARKTCVASCIKDKFGGFQAILAAVLARPIPQREISLDDDTICYMSID